MVRKTREEKIKLVLSKEPHLTYLEAMEVVLHGKGKVSLEPKPKKKPPEVKSKKKTPNNDAMYRAISGGFETNRRKH